MNKEEESAALDATGTTTIIMGSRITETKSKMQRHDEWIWNSGPL